jgi:ribosomal protein S1
MGDGIQGYMAKKDLDGYIPEKNEEIEAEVVSIDDKERRVVLSLKVYHRSTEKQALEDFRSKQGEATATLSDVIHKD